MTPPAVTAHAVQLSTANADTQARLIVASEVLREVRRTHYKSPDSLKSPNKVRGGHSMTDENRRRSQADVEIGIERRALHQAVVDARLESAQDLYDIVRASKAKNCGELALMAIEQFAQRGLKAVNLTIGAHTAAALMPEGHAGGLLERDMRRWDRAIVICDPWSNICCCAPDFEERFCEKMIKWDSDKKML